VGKKKKQTKSAVSRHKDGHGGGAFAERKGTNGKALRGGETVRTKRRQQWGGGGKKRGEGASRNRFTDVKIHEKGNREPTPKGRKKRTNRHPLWKKKKKKKGFSIYRNNGAFQHVQKLTSLWGEKKRTGLGPEGGGGNKPQPSHRRKNGGPPGRVYSEEKKKKKGGRFMKKKKY